MWSTARQIKEGDLVIAWLTRDTIQPLVISPGKELNTKFGVYRHSDLLGVPYGSKIGSRNGKGFIHLLRPTPELWTLALPHRTQILYLADIAFVTSWLDIKPGSRVIEAGTGSGSFSHSVARTIGPEGHLWSYEFHEARANKAREEFTRHGMDQVVTLTHRNVCKDGFTIVNTADSVFLDLPAPWDAVEHAKVALRKDTATRICCFSPCMEQVLRTVTALNDAGFSDITMYETLIRPHQVDILPSLPSISTASDTLKQSEVRREAKRQRQIASSRESRLAQVRGGKRKHQEAEDEVEGGQEGVGKKVKTDEAASSPQEEVGGGGVSTVVDAAGQPSASGSVEQTAAGVVLGGEIKSSLTPGTSATAGAGAGTGASDAATQNDGSSAKLNVSKAFPEVRGHTSYLTFAVLLPEFVHEMTAKVSVVMPEDAAAMEGVQSVE